MKRSQASVTITDSSPPSREEVLKRRILAAVSPDLIRIERELEAQVFGAATLTDVVSRYIINSGGKRLRPLLMILSARLCGYEGDRDARLSVAFEFLHVATLLHDDVVDGADTRRNRPAANTLWGNQAVVLVGDFLYSKALMLAIEYDDMQIMASLAEAANLMSEGEILQLANLGRANLSEREYFEIIRRKTAALMSAACRVGAVLSKASLSHQEKLSTYGHHLGIAFQLVDDLLDYSGVAQELGKPVGRDFAERKATLPFIYAFSTLEKREQDKLQDLFTANVHDAMAFEEIKELIWERGGIEYTKKMAHWHVQQAKEALSPFPETEVKETLVSIAEYTLLRRF